MNYTMPTMFDGDGYAPKIHKTRPYVGVTGFMNVDDITTAINTYHDARDGTDTHLFMLGILLSHHVIKNGFHPDRATRYPSLGDIPELLESGKDRRVLRFLHYNTKDPRLFSEIVSISERIDIKGLVDGIQFNVGTLPTPDMIQMIRKTFPWLQLVVQLNASVLRDVGAGFAVESLSTMDAQYALIDPSGGKGKDIDVSMSTALYNQLKKHAKVTIGFAGGFSDDNIEQKTREYADAIGTMDFCMDAEGRLRDPADAMVMDKVKKYIRGFFRGIKNQ